MVTTDHHKKKKTKTKKRETRYYADNYFLPASLNIRGEKWLICLWLNLHVFLCFFMKVEE